MSVLCIRVDDADGLCRDDSLMTSLINVARALVVPERWWTAFAAEHAEDEICLVVDDVAEAQARQFADGITELSSSTGRTFTLFVTLDEDRRKKQLQQYPDHVLGDSNVVHVRPTEGPAIYGYFRYLLGAA